jgi:hypothetical protein
MALLLLMETVIGLLRPLLQSYVEWSWLEPRSLAEREERLGSVCEAICQVLLSEDAKADEDQVRPGRCECGGRFQSKGLRKRTLVTTVGVATYRRRYYECERCHAHDLPVDRAWGVESGSLSPGAKALGVDLACALPFREAREWLARMGRVEIGLSTLWRVTQQAGAERVATRQAEQEGRKTRKGAAAFLLRLQKAGGEGRWALAVDGLFLRIGRQWKEVKVAAVGRLNEKGEWKKGQTSYTASRQGADVFRQQVVGHALSRGVTRKTALVTVSDGAAWIEALWTRHFPQAVRVCDWWHAVQYLWQGSQAIYGEGTEMNEPLVKTLTALLWKGDVKGVKEGLEAERKAHPIRNVERKEAYRKAQGYLERHQDAMRYADYRQDHWPIGSGPAEATCKMIQARMKRSGMNWSEKGAEHLLFLRADYCTRLNAKLYPLS